MLSIKCKICQELVKVGYSDKYGVGCNADLDYIMSLSFLDWASDQDCTGLECYIPTFDYTPYTAVSTISCSVIVTDDSPASSCSIIVT